MQVEAQGKTDRGRVRSTNQDSFLVGLENNLFIVADGMGGHAGGEIASSICVSAITERLLRNEIFLNPQFNHPDQRIHRILASVVNAASLRIYERSLEEPALQGMGTTASVVKIEQNYAYYAHVGDSRIYLIRSGFIYQVTDDHSLVGEQIRAGILTEQEAESHYLRNVITRSVGYQEEEEIDTGCIPVENNDYFILCSDGLYGKVSDQDIARLVRDHGIEATTHLIQYANDKGGDDNITVIVVKVKL